MICIVLQLQEGRDLTREFSMKRCTSNIQFIVNKVGLLLTGYPSKSLLWWQACSVRQS